MGAQKTVRYVDKDHFIWSADYQRTEGKITKIMWKNRNVFFEKGVQVLG